MSHKKPGYHGEHTKEKKGCHRCRRKYELLMAVRNVNAFKYFVLIICHQAGVQAKTDELVLGTMTTSGGTQTNPGT